MGGGDNELIVKSILDTAGFEKGSKRLKSAVSSLSKSVQTMGKTAQSSLSSVGSIARRILPSIIGVGSAYGIISKAVSQFMSENKALSAQMSNVWSGLGNLIGPIITQIINWVSTAVSWFLKFLSLLGVASANANKTAKAAGGGAAALKKTLAGFDELNLLNDNSGGGGGGANSNFKPEDLPKWLEDLAKALKNKMWDQAADIIIKQFNKLIKTFKSKAYEWGKKAGEYFAGAVHILARMIKEIDWKGIGQGIARFLNGLFEDVDATELGTILVGKFVIAFKILIGFLEDLNWGRLAEIISGILIGAFNTLADAILEADFQKIGKNIRTFFEKIDWEGIKEAFKTLLKNAVQGAIDLLWGLLDMPGEPTNIWENVSAGKIASTFLEILKKAFKDVVGYIWKVVGLPETPDNFWKNINGETLKNSLKEKIQKAAQGAINAIWDALSMPGEPPNITAVIGGIIDKLSELASAISTFISETFEGTFKPFLEYTVSDTVGIAKFIENLAGALTKVVTVSTSAGLPKFLREVWSSIREMVSATISTAADVIPGFIEQIGNALGKIDYSTLGSIVGNLKKFYNDFLLPAITMVEGSGVVGTFCDTIINFFNLAAAVIDSVLPSLLDFLNNFVMPFATMNIAGIQGFLDGFSNLFKELKSVIKGEESFGEMMENLWNSFYGQQENVETLVGGYGDLSQAVRDCGNSFNELTIVSDGVNLPSEDVEDFNNKINDMVSQVTGSVEGIEGAGQATEEYKSKVNALREAYIEYARTHPEVYGDAEKTAELTSELAKLTAEYIAQLKEQGIELDNNGQIVSDIADAVGDQAEATQEGADALKGAADAATEAGNTLKDLPEAADEAGQGYTDAGTEAGEGAGVVEEETADMKDNVTTDFQDMTEESLAHMKELSDGAVESINELKATATTGLDEVESEVTSTTSSIKTTVDTALANLKSAVSGALSSLRISVASDMTAIHSTISTKFGYISSSAFTWGSDLIINMRNGIVAAWNALVDTIAAVAAMIRDYLGFSEPKKGPLSDFHTFMPDMMNLMADGIEDNIPVAAKAAADVAEAVSDEIQGGDYSLSGIGSDIDVTMDKFSDKIVTGFTNLMDRLQSIADNVVFKMPDVAGGGFLPYGVGGSWDGITKESENDELISAVQDLRELVLDFRDAVDNMQWVAQFGDLRMIAAQITKIQKQTERAKG